MTDNYIVKKFVHTGLTKYDLENYLREVDQDFNPTLSSRLDITEWVQKLVNRAVIIVAISTKERAIIGVLACYCNDLNRNRAHVSTLSVKKNFRRQGIAKHLLMECIEFAKLKGFKLVRVESWNKNPAIKLYLKFGFREVKRVTEAGNQVKVTFEKSLTHEFN